MQTRLILTTYERPELLQQVLLALTAQRTHIPFVHIIDDFSQNPQVPRLLNDFKQRWGVDCRVDYNTMRHGMPANVNSALMRAFKWDGVEAAVIVDSDTLMGPDDWFTKLTQFLSDRPEAGIVAPDKPGCYVRLRRNGYDEVEWAVSICYATRANVWQDIMREDGYWLDTQLQTSWDPDICYRVRRLGYRVALVPSTSVQDLGEGLSTIPERFGIGNTNFNAKWNRLLLGRHIYKSPTFLRWEDMPLNVLFRRLVNVQQNTYQVAKTEGSLCHHAAERVTMLACQGNMPTAETYRRFLEADIWVHKDQTLQDIDPDLMRGKRPFDFDKDLQPFSLHDKSIRPNDKADRAL